MELKTRDSKPRIASPALAKRMLKARTPSRQVHHEYLEWAKSYCRISRKHPARFRLRGTLMTARLDLYRSVLFSRPYLVAWIDDNDDFGRAFPGTDAVVTPISDEWLLRPMPLIMAPMWRRARLAEEFTEILEHEIVHVNQQLMGSPVPGYSAKTSSDLLECFFHDVEIEHEAHLIQYLHWPPTPMLEKTKLSIDQWTLLRAYTQAVEEIFRRTARLELPRRIIAPFLEAVPEDAVPRFAKIGCTRELVSWFQARWRLDIPIAVQVVVSQGMDRSDLKCVTDWLQKQNRRQAGRDQT